MDGVVPVAVEGVLHDVEGAHLLRGDLLPEGITAPIDFARTTSPDRIVVFSVDGDD
jgi:hypothetical protein